ncbi:MULTISPECIES: hypothetical protein [Brevundimonas]|uniref:hypothetical protein n=1 Tax=Brevundimonas TaxID=41275 RepID=UPI0025B952DB|nr:MULTISPECIES: hypothetical protein [Brevundimonas]
MLRILAAALALSTAALTTAPAPALAAAVADTPQMSRQEARAHDLFVQANTDFQRRGYPALARRLPALRQALDRMSADYGQLVEQAGQHVVRVTDPGDVLLMMVGLLAAAGKNGNGAKGATALPNVYGDIALMLASEAVEARRYEEGISYLDRALKVQPKN